MSAIGVLVEPRFPDLRRIETFEGDAFAVHPDDIEGPNCRRGEFRTHADALRKFFLGEKIYEKLYSEKIIQ